LWSRGCAELAILAQCGPLRGPAIDGARLAPLRQQWASMTGPPGVIDVTGGMFGVIGILAVVEERHRTGRGQKVIASLFETTVYLVGQHMAQLAVTGKPAAPMPASVSAWAIYDVVETKDDPVFIGVVTDALWEKFCTLFDLVELWADESTRTNNERVLARDRIMPQIRELISDFTRAEVIAKLEGAGLPFAPIGRPEELFDDPHLAASGGLENVMLDNGTKTRLPTIPIMMNGQRPSCGTVSILTGSYNYLSAIIYIMLNKIFD
jgi:crotonobetainyl-CoA:carnitine CoA-transferase CaiB-like acyl-CoA transferase